MKTPAFWHPPPDAAAKAHPAATLLAPFGALYEAAGALRRALTRPVALPVPVICVGNVSAGGAGKTPTALALLRRLSARGFAPHALSRGYGGSAKGPLQVDPAIHDAALVGDEPLLLAAVAPTWTARDRAAGALAAVAAGAGCLVMDDGHQNPALRKDLSIVAVDGGAGFGNRRVMPAGPLRESVAAGLARADMVLVIGDDRYGAAAEAAAAGLPVLTGRLVPDPAAAAALRGRRVFAFAGIGRPEKFFDTLREIGAETVETLSFPDHHPFTAAEIDDALKRAAALGAVPVATVKDRVRLPPDRREAVAALPVDLVLDDETPLTTALERLKRH